MDGLGFRGVIEEEHTLVGTRDRARPRHPLTTADDAGAEAEWCESLYGGLLISSSARLKPTSESPPRLTRA
jgi:hypothetical protein